MTGAWPCRKAASKRATTPSSSAAFFDGSLSIHGLEAVMVISGPLAEQGQ